MSDEKVNKTVAVLIDRGLITKKNGNLVTLTKEGQKEFAISSLLCLEEKKHFKDAAEMKTAIIISTILSTGATEEKLLADMEFVLEKIIDNIIPDFQEAIESVDFSQGVLCQPEK